MKNRKRKLIEKVNDRNLKIGLILIFVISVALLNGYLVFNFFYKASDVLIKTLVLN